MEAINDVRVWLTIISIGVTIGGLFYFFKTLSDKITKLGLTVESCRKSLSDEHTRHDENLIERISDIKYGLEKHISQEEVESAHQQKSREEITEIRREINKLRRK